MSATTTNVPPAQAARPAAAAPCPQRLGDWELLREIGRGQLASVYQARPVGSRGEVPAAYALKVLHPHWQEDPRGVATLAREVHVGRRVGHQHLMPILACQLNSPPYYLAMPLLEGFTLAEMIRRPLELDLPTAFWNARQAAEALDALHQAGWIHTDVKPNNLFVSTSGHVTLLDLGFARHERESRALAERVLLGTLSYMAPEMLCSSSGGDAKSDVYSLGVTLFEMLSGRLPFDAADIAELTLQHRQSAPSDLRTFAPHLPTRAARLVQQMLSKEPLRRPATKEVVKRLAALEIETFAERQAAA